MQADTAFKTTPTVALKITFVNKKYKKTPQARIMRPISTLVVLSL